MNELSRCHEAEYEAAWLLEPLPSSDEVVEFLTGLAYEIVTTVVGKEQVAA